MALTKLQRKVIILEANKQFDQGKRIFLHPDSRPDLNPPPPP
jgi:hypothetical protein